MNNNILKISSFIKRHAHSLLAKLAKNRQVSVLSVFAKSVVFALLFSIEKNRKNLGSIQTAPSIRSLIYSFVGMSFNINHLGSVYMSSSGNTGTSFCMEKDVIEWTKKIFNISDNNIEGYVTSGGTESNLFAMWSLREYLSKKEYSKTCVIVSPLTHYSVLKAARMLCMEVIHTSLDNKTWSMDTTKLKTIIINAIQRGFTNIMIPATLGYSSTGTCDSPEKIDKVLTEIDKEFKNIHSAFWIDAAAQGLPIAFLNKNFTPFLYKHAYAISVDFHKLGSTPIPSGVIIFKKELRKAIQNKIDYLPESDVTVSGSRPGFAAMAIWSNIYSKSNSAWFNFFSRSEKLKEEFISQFILHFPKENIISTKHSLTIALVVDKNFHRLSDRLEKKYSLYLGTVTINKRGDKLMHYKIHFISGVSKGLIDEFVFDIVHYQKTINKNMKK